MRVIADVLIATTTAEASRIKRDNPALRQHLVLTPASRNRLRGCVVGTYTWTPDAKKLPARTRMALKATLMPTLLASEHHEIDFEELVHQNLPTAWYRHGVPGRKSAARYRGSSSWSLATASMT